MTQIKRTSINLVVVVSFLVLLVAMNGCDGFKVGNAFLKKPPGGAVTQDTVFSSAERAKKFLWHAYESLPFGLPTWPKTGNNSRPYDNNVMWGDMLVCLTDIDQSYNNNGGHEKYYQGVYGAGRESSPFLQIILNITFIIPVLGQAYGMPTSL